MEKNKSALTMSALAALLLFALMLTTCQLLGDDIETLREKAGAKDSGGNVAGGSVSDGSDIFGAWDDTKGWNLTEAGITADNFSNSGINGVNNENFDDIVEWFNNLTSPGSAPKNLDELIALVDTALIGIASENADFLDAGNYADRADVEQAISGLIKNGAKPVFEWVSNNKVIVHVGKYKVEFPFNGDIPVSDSKCAVCGEEPCVCVIDQQTLNVSNFIVSNNEKTYNGSNQSVTVSYSGEGINTTTAGTITIRYSGANGTTYAESPTAPVNAGTYDVKAETSGGTVYAAFGKATVGSLTINKATGSFAAPGAINITYTAGMTLANVNLPNDYSWNTPTTNLNAGNGQLLPASYTNPSGNYMSANGNIAVNVAKAVGTFGNPSAIDITYTPALTLANLPLSPGYKWGVPATSLNAGNGQSFPATFNDPSGNYEIASGNIVVNVAEEDGNFIAHSEINTTYTPTRTLADLTLSPNYEWLNPTTVLNAGNGLLYPATYTDPSGNYTAANGNIKVNVAKAVGAFGNPNAINITYTSTLTLADLSRQAGYEWNNPTTSLSVANSGQSFPATYTDPSGNYTTASGSITVNVAKAPGVFGNPAAIGITYASTLTLTDINLPNGYTWNTTTTSLSAGNGQSFPATYTDSSGNYLAANGNITVNVAKATGAAVAAPTMASRTHNSITINAVNAPANGQTVEYARNTINTAPETGWQTGLTFNGLSEGTTYYIFARAEGNSNYNAGAAVSTAMTTLVQESFTITIENFSDINTSISAGTIYLIGGAGRPLSTTLTVANPQQYDAGSVKWYFNGNPITSGITGTHGETLTINTFGEIFNSIGQYSVTVEIKKDGKLYTKIVSFEVKA